MNVVQRELIVIRRMVVLFDLLVLVFAACVANAKGLGTATEAYSHNQFSMKGVNFKNQPMPDMDRLYPIHTTLVYDTDLDGTLDFLCFEYDVTGDRVGNVETWHRIFSYDETTDSIKFRRAQFPVMLFIDLNEDGIDEVVFYDFDEDGIVDKIMEQGLTRKYYIRIFGRDQ